MTEALLFLAVLTVFCWLTVWEMRRFGRLRLEIGRSGVEHWLTENERPKLFRAVLVLMTALPVVVGSMMLMSQLKVFAK
ncbi:hypothetical protein [Novosphingobium aerophilum]|uniref:hypothetical protein n=1 Tax=Novosphingobium aerophilum TaxID=2839843 RepID=UPI003FD412EE